MGHTHVDNADLVCCFCALVSFAYILSVLQVKFEESEMIPKSGKSPADSRKSVGIQEFAALARSSLNGDNFFYCFVFLHSD